MKERKYYITKIPFFFILLGIFELLCITLYIRNEYLYRHSHYVPKYNYTDLKQICCKENLSENDYKTLFYQTGLSPHAINALRSRSDYSEKIELYQNIFFKNIKVDSTNNLFLTKTEYIDSPTYMHNNEFVTAPLENGYIMYTPSSSTLGWRNGHIALVVDAEKKQIFEAGSIGELSQIRSYEHWKTYPAFILLRIKPKILSNNNTLIDEVISTAKNKLLNLPYSLFCGLLTPKAASECTKSHCAHIIWYAFSSHGIDIDSNSGIIVTPENILNCDLFEVVQIYGVNPELYVNRMAY